MECRLEDLPKLMTNEKRLQFTKDIEYIQSIEKYISTDYKLSIDWEEFLYKYMEFRFQYTNEFILQVKIFYETSSTFPEFFIKLNNRIDKKEKTHFFRWWLHNFIIQTINTRQIWYV